MLWVQLALSAVSVILYVLINQSGSQKRASGDSSTRHAYFMGLLFAGLYYYGFPLWWWRYGIKTTAKLLLTCIIAGAICQAVLRTIGMIVVDDFGKSFAISMLLAVPIRAIAGVWVARHDKCWRDSIVAERKAKSQAVVS